ncbi:DUF11 domain-containing protein [Candidatus Saccharibacteria bacterium]|nr:DUF11 domain-containing protein [Candidatus Saccharibacteria bacterium]
MKNIKTVLGLAAFSAIAGTMFVAPSVFAWGDSANGRATYTNDQINNGAIDDKIVLNSISDNPTVGNELYFVQAREDGTNNLWNPSEMTVEDGKTYVIRMYVHNNNRMGTAMVAKDIAARFVVPTNSAKELSVSGVLSSSNATPNKVWDDVVLKSGENFHLTFVSGSVKIENKTSISGTTLPDSIINGDAVKLGYDSLNGELPGCYGYSAFVSFKVKVTYDYDFTVEKKVRVIGGEKNWFDQVYANVGDTVEYKISYKNTSSVSEKNVQIIEKLGSDLEYIKGSTKLYNANNKEGVAISSDNITTTGIGIGDYAAGTNATITFRAKVVNKNLGCGADNVLRSWSQGYIGANDTMKQDYADVLVHPACPDKPTPVDPVTPTPTPVTPAKTVTVLPETGADTIAASVVGAGSLATSAGAYIASRKKRF